MMMWKCSLFGLQLVDLVQRQGHHVLLQLYLFLAQRLSLFLGVG
jgi:hypothetical protein